MPQFASSPATRACSTGAASSASSQAATGSRSGLVELDPDASGEVHGPLDFAPHPDSVARRLFDQPTIEAHLDRLARGQLDDGGWTFNWPAWSPLAEMDWRGSLTVDALGVLAANGRWSGEATAAASRA